MGAPGAVLMIHRVAGREPCLTVQRPCVHCCVCFFSSSHLHTAETFVSAVLLIGYRFPLACLLFRFALLPC